MIILTLYDDPETQARAKEAGAVAAFDKHSNWDGLLSAIYQAAERG